VDARDKRGHNDSIKSSPALNQTQLRILATANARVIDKTFAQKHRGRGATLK
jgi:hypothetical protein